MTALLRYACRVVDDRLDLSIVGSRIVRASFTEVPDSSLIQVEQVWHEVAAVPEPSALLLLAGA